jgi:hypothetical protein
MESEINSKDFPFQFSQYIHYYQLSQDYPKSAMYLIFCYYIVVLTTKTANISKNYCNNYSFLTIDIKFFDNQIFFLIKSFLLIY